MDHNFTIQSFALTYITAFTVDVTHNNSSENVALESEVGRKVVLGIFFGLCILTAIMGNLLVCTAVFTDRRLKSFENNYFIVSLAVADLVVSCLVMPFAMVNDIQQKWYFGGIFCRIWISTDVMCSTASILNLCVISFDRYKRVQNAMYYDMWMTTRKALAFIAFVWIISALISMLPIHLGWDRNSIYANQTLIPDSECIIKFNFIYAFGSSIISFYVPCLIMLVMYIRLFLFARKHVISMKRQKLPGLSPPGERTYNISYRSSITFLKTVDHKATFTLGIITGVFLCCWLPFFIINPINAYDPDLVPPVIFVVFTWLGYLNSCLNPFIYSIFNRHFRKAFKRILCLRTFRKDEFYSSSVPSISSTRVKSKTTENDTQLSGDYGTNLQETSKDHLLTEKVTCL